MSFLEHFLLCFDGKIFIFIVTKILYILLLAPALLASRSFVFEGKKENSLKPNLETKINYKPI